MFWRASCHISCILCYWLLPSHNSYCWVECENVLYWTSPPLWLLHFWICDSNPLALFWVIYTYEWRFMPESSMCQYYPIKLGCSVAPEIALQCNINAAILGILPLWNTQGSSDAIATCYYQGDLSVTFHVAGYLCKLMKSWKPCLIYFINNWMEKKINAKINK